MGQISREHTVRALSNFWCEDARVVSGEYSGLGGIQSVTQRGLVVISGKDSSQVPLLVAACLIYEHYPHFLYYYVMCSRFFLESLTVTLRRTALRFTKPRVSILSAQCARLVFLVALKNAARSASSSLRS